MDGRLTWLSHFKMMSSTKIGTSITGSLDMVGLPPITAIARLRHINAKVAMLTLSTDDDVPIRAVAVCPAY